MIFIVGRISPNSSLHYQIKRRLFWETINKIQIISDYLSSNKTNSLQNISMFLPFNFLLYFIARCIYRSSYAIIAPRILLLGFLGLLFEGCGKTEHKIQTYGYSVFDTISKILQQFFVDLETVECVQQFASIRIFCYSYVNVLICMLCYSFSINIPSVLHAKADREYNLQLSLSLSVIPSLLCSGQICSWGSTLQEPMILQKVIFSFHPFFLGEGYGLQKMIVQYYKGHTLLPGLCYQSNSQTWEKNNIG